MTREVTDAQWLACVGKGWHPIVQPLIDHCRKNNLVIFQVKEKFGGLRFYSEVNDELAPMVAAAEAKAEVTCEICGEPGTISGAHWIKCMCPTHHSERT